MLTLPDASEAAEAQAEAPIDWPAYRPYRAAVVALTPLSPHFTRVTFSGPEFATFGTAALDQYLKVVFPLPGVGLSEFGVDDADTQTQNGGWYAKWRKLPDDRRNPFRTYTIRAVRAAEREIDVDFVVHGDAGAEDAGAQGAGAVEGGVGDASISEAGPGDAGRRGAASTTAGDGPAARWLQSVRVGDEVVVVGPDARSSAALAGLNWRPGRADRMLLVADETAAPAVCGIIESLPHGTEARAFIEVPHGGDALDVSVPSGCAVTWLPREGHDDAGVHGGRLEAAVRAWVAEHPEHVERAGVEQELPDIDVDSEMLWDSLDDEAVAARGGFYAWIAGEAAAVKRLRRFLVSETGVDRSQVAFMGYWRLGRSEGQ